MLVIAQRRNVAAESGLERADTRKGSACSSGTHEDAKRGVATD